LIVAWSKVCQQIDGWKLHLVGDGELREALLQQIEDLNLSDSVILGKAETDMLSVYQSASVLAMSSRYEGLPMVLLEAQAAGLPIVSFACKCGPKDVVEEGGDGFLVEEGDVDALADRLVLLMKDEALRKQMGAVAYARSERYLEERIMKQWMDLFDDVLIEK
jgi:glycosyltransferase involved in cell wall biosynthesis